MEIGIIGGSDGPTAIFLASSVNWPLSYSRKYDFRLEKEKTKEMSVFVIHACI